MFIGNTKAVKLLEKSIKNGKVSQAYLFSGPESVGKFTLAKIFARSLIQNKSLNLEIEDEGVLPDLIILEPETEEKKGIKKEKEIKVEDIRKVQKELATFPYAGKFKILIINNAHKMGVSSQNALLKILEEPNETSIIILITHDDREILSTIKSRCQKVSFFLAANWEIEKIFEKSQIPKELFVFSMGCPGRALEMVGHQEKIEKIKEELLEFKRFPQMGINERIKLAERLANDSSEATRRMEVWIFLIRNSIFEKKDFSGFFSFRSIEKIEKSLETIKKTNANPRLILENLFLSI